MTSFLRPVILVICCFLPIQLFAQSDAESRLAATSWKKGEVQIVEKTIVVRLEPGKPAFEEYIFGKNGEQFLFKVLEIEDKEIDTPYWKIELREVVKTGNNAVFGKDLLYRDEPGPEWRHVFYVETASYLFPDIRRSVRVNGSLWIEGRKQVVKPETIRVYKVMAFNVVISLDQIQFEAGTDGRLLSARLTLEFENECTPK